MKGEFCLEEVSRADEAVSASKRWRCLKVFSLRFLTLSTLVFLLCASGRCGADAAEREGSTSVEFIEQISFSL